MDLEQIFLQRWHFSVMNFAIQLYNQSNFFILKKDPFSNGTSITTGLNQCYSQDFEISPVDKWHSTGSDNKKTCHLRDF